MRRSQVRPVPVVSSSAFKGFRFPPEVIVLAVRWYLRFGLSYRDVEELLVERGIEVDHVTVYRWVQHFTPLLADAARPCRHSVGDRWYGDETYVKCVGAARFGREFACGVVQDGGEVQRVGEQVRVANRLLHEIVRVAS
jgi:transposase, IS6 family